MLLLKLHSLLLTYKFFIRFSTKGYFRVSHLSFIAYFHLCELNTCQNHDFQNFMFMNHFCGLFVNVSSLSDYYYNIINKNQKDSENDCRIAVMFSLSQYLHLIQRHKSVANLSSQCRCLLYEYCIMCHSTISAVNLIISGF